MGLVHEKIRQKLVVAAIFGIFPTLIQKIL